MISAALPPSARPIDPEASSELVDSDELEIVLFQVPLHWKVS